MNYREIKEIKGSYNGLDHRFAIVASRFNESITKNLLQSALDCLARHGVEEKNIMVIWVPGAFEIPLVAQSLAMSNYYDAVICLGAVIRGETPHFDYVAGQVAAGVSKAALETGVPVIFGVLTTDTIEQAIERSGSKAGNKGFESALNALEMCDVMESVALECFLEDYEAELAEGKDEEESEELER